MKAQTKILAVALGMLFLVFAAGCGHREADNSIDGMWYVYDNVEGSATHGQIVATMDISYDDNTGYHVKLDTTDGKLHKNYKAVWGEDERHLSIDDGLSLNLSWMEYHIVGQWPISWVLDMDGTGSAILSSFGTKKYKASRYGYPHRLLHAVTGD